MKFLFSVSVIVSGLFLSTQTHAGFNFPEKIIGENDLVAVNADGSNIPLKYKELLNAFGSMSMGCTATHIGNGIAITAGHCFWAGDTLSRDTDCKDVTIEWGVREGVSPYLKSNCEKILFAQRNREANDFAVIKVFPVPETSIGVELTRKAAAGDEVTIFSHPEELPLRWSKSCIVEVMLDPKLPPGAMHHKCDTNPGSSGATIIDVKTNKIVGIHDGGRLTSATNGMNYGTYMTSPELVDALKSLGYR